MQPTRQQQLTHVSMQAQNCHHLRFDPFKMNIFFFDQQKNKSKQNLVQSTTIWLFTYNLSKVSIFTNNTSLVQQNKNKKQWLVTWINLLPITFTQQENTVVRWTVLTKKGGEERNKRLQFPEFRSSLHAYFVWELTKWTCERSTWYQLQHPVYT